ncbi:hypothetical protein AB0I55_22345 [Actinocatenispora sera]|uniref:hypothetical protein n=1 Tax=Actinocatenispora sera TaxID=390989 RepID=UPI0034067A6E
MTLEEALIGALVESLMFLEDSNPEEVDPDSVVRAMENIMAPFHELEEDQQLALRDRLAQISRQENDNYDSRFIAGVADMIGLPSQSDQE